MSTAAKAPRPNALDSCRAIRNRLAPIAAEYPFSPRVIDHGGVLQHYVDEGAKDAEALLFVHGNPTWSFAWRRLIRPLADRVRCVAPDHVGCGMSDKPQDYDYTLAQHVENLERLVLALDLRDLTLVVHDWGGPIGLGFARRHPERIARLVVLNTAAFPGPVPLRISACRVPGVGPFAVRRMNAFARAATWMAVERPLTREAKRGYLLPYRSFDDRVAIDAFVRDIPRGPSDRAWDELTATEEALGTFTDRPVAILWGERDWCFTPAFRRRWQAAFPGAGVRVFENAGHYLFEDAAPELLHQIESFLARQRR